MKNAAEKMAKEGGRRFSVVAVGERGGGRVAERRRVGGVAGAVEVVEVVGRIGRIGQGAQSVEGVRVSGRGVGRLRVGVAERAPAVDGAVDGRVVPRRVEAVGGEVLLGRGLVVDLLFGGDGGGQSQQEDDALDQQSVPRSVIKAAPASAVGVAPYQVLEHDVVES